MSYLSEDPAGCQGLALPVSPLKVLLHDLKNPLAHIQGTTELLRLLLEDRHDNREDNRDDYEQYLEILELSARRAQLLLQRVQLLEQLRTQQIVVRLQAQPMHQIAQETVRLYQIWARQRGLKLELQLHPVWVCADEGFLTQIVDNLLSNAIKHAAQLGQIRVEVSQAQGQGLLRISDQGPGISKSRLAMIFEPSCENPASGEAPHGLGLAISKQLCELMAGRISCRSESGHGSVFDVSLPLSD